MRGAKRVERGRSKVEEGGEWKRVRRMKGKGRKKVSEGRKKEF